MSIKPAPAPASSKHLAMLSNAPLQVPRRLSGPGWSESTEIPYWEQGEWWLAGDAKPWQPDAVNVAGVGLTDRSQPGHRRPGRMQGNSPLAYFYPCLGIGCCGRGQGL